MKVNITLSLDEEVVHYLRGQKDYSPLANKVLKEYIEGAETENLLKLKQKLVEINQKQAKDRRLKKEIVTKIKKITEKERKILKITRGLNEREMELLKNCDSRIKLSLIYKQTSLKNHKFIDVKKIWTELKGGGAI